MLELALATTLGPVALDVTATVEPGRCLALAGPSGAGKTSVLRGVAGLLSPERGTVRVAGETWLDTERGIDRDADQRRCGYLFQQFALFPHLRGWQNVAYPLRGLRRAARRDHATELLERFGVAHLADVTPATYSGGERQRVALARTLAREPSVLLLDEPLSALDARTRAQAMRTLAELLTHTDVPTLLVTHDFAEAATLADEIAVVDAGRVLQRGTADELAAGPVSGFVADFTGAVVLTGTAAPGPGGLTAVELDAAGTILSVDPGEGAVAASVFPWEIALAPSGGPATDSAQNRLDGRVVASTALGNRIRVTVDAGQPLVAEITDPGAERLDLTPGSPIGVSWKAAATRLTAR